MQDPSDSTAFGADTRRAATGGRRRRVVTALVVAVIAIGAPAAWLYNRPFSVVRAMRAAARDGDREALVVHIDLAALQASFAQSLREENRPDSAASPENAVMRSLLGDMAQDAAAAIVTPELVAMLLTGRPARPFAPSSFGVYAQSAEARAIMDRYRDPAAERAEAEAARAAESRLSIAQAYESSGRFVVKVKSPAWDNGTFALVLVRHGLATWKLEALRAEK
jgi:hypothetical protein